MDTQASTATARPRSARDAARSPRGRGGALTAGRTVAFALTTSSSQPQSVRARGAGWSTAAYQPWESPAVQVRDGMTTLVLNIGPAHTLREAAKVMAGRKVGAAVVLDPDTSGVGILTQRDVLDAIGNGLDPDREVAGNHLTSDLVFAAPDWTLEQAAQAMIRGGFRHLVVMDGDEVTGMLSVRDIVRCWMIDSADVAS